MRWLKVKNNISTNTIVINEIYDGTFAGYENTLSVTGTINGDNILTIAKRNEE